jgi:hypothetical protein
MSAGTHNGRHEPRTPSLGERLGEERPASAMLATRVMFKEGMVAWQNATNGTHEDTKAGGDLLGVQKGANSSTGEATREGGRVAVGMLRARKGGAGWFDIKISTHPGDLAPHNRRLHHPARVRNTRPCTRHLPPLLRQCLGSWVAAKGTARFASVRRCGT